MPFFHKNTSEEIIAPVCELCEEEVIHPPGGHFIPPLYLRTTTTGINRFYFCCNTHSPHMLAHVDAEKSTGWRIVRGTDRTTFRLESRLKEFWQRLFFFFSSEPLEPSETHFSPRSLSLFLLDPPYLLR